MLIVRWLRYLFGYVEFEIYGRYPERLMNVLSHRGVSVWGVVRSGKCLKACIPIRDYKRLHAKKGKCRARIRHIRAVGLFVKLRCYRERVGFAVGIGVFFLIIKILSLFLWQIEIVGASAVPESAIYAALEEVGIAYGTRLSEVDAFSVGEALTIVLPDLSWASVNIEGSKATVNVSEVRIVPERDDQTPCNLIARVDGQIIEHRVTDGKVMFKTGDAVVKGDLLVSGMVEYKNGTTALKHASGPVIAETKRTVCWFEPLCGVERLRTGKTQTKRVLEFFGLKIPLYLGSVQYPYETEYEEMPLTIAGVKLPISIHKAKFYEVVEHEYTFSTQDAERVAREKIENITKTELEDVKILNKNEKVDNQNDGILVEYLYICHENIALEEILSISTINFEKDVL